MPAIPSTLHNQLCECLLHCGPFTSDQALQAIFVDTCLSQWKAGLPEAASDAERVRLTIEYLSDKRNVAGENGLVLLLSVLRDQTPSEDASHCELAQLAAELEQVAPIPDTPQWDAALDRYREWVKRTYGTMRVLGKHEPVSLEGIYTDVYLLEQPSASRYADLSNLPSEKKSKRLDGLELVRQLDTQILVILGKPGAGKTTFLKHIALQAAAGQLDDRVPIFVALREWADDDDLLDILTEPFTACDLADPRAYVEHLLQTGRALLLFDALDEMSEQARSAFIKTLERFSRRHLNCHILLTCRTAATPYQFERAKTVEVADFTDEQMRAFAANWFGEDTAKAEKFRRQIEQDKRLRDLGRTPLLLGMLCLTFDERGDFPQKRADLYHQALDTLLIQWDESRNIERDAMRKAEIYHELSLGRKNQMFAHIAHTTFEQGEIFIPQEQLESLLTNYLITIPNAPARIDIAPAAILRAIESQHGILVEYAHGVYAFLHPTFQEYYAAHYMVTQDEDGDVEFIPYLLSHVHEDRWREVILLTASMLSNADAFFMCFLITLESLIHAHVQLVSFFAWVKRKEVTVQGLYSPEATRAYYVWLALALDYNHHWDRDRILDRTRVLALDCAFALDHTLASALSRTLSLEIQPGRVHGRALDRNLALDRALALILDRNRILDRDLALILDRNRILDRDLASVLHLKRNPALDFTRARTLNRDIARSRADDLGFAKLATALNTLDVPEEEASETVWSPFANQLRALMIQNRNVGHNWNFTEEQAVTLEKYFRAVTLLVQCLDVAHITDHVAVKTCLLLPPGDKET